ncbi:hypothetical protein P8C59_009460 [Phyllachora maydis]|uniref:Bud22 domain-containing protein n=1 Tax=Phyllachora maydis TaxID=1825666 RepID=A0AAD9ID97_9PEZI|nr:hypothetical protein P8C59_009460 [Phyllachora maydis]
MPKRARPETDVRAVFAQGSTDLFRALKAAKGFERQHQAKRIRRGGADDPARLARVHREVQVLKSLDLRRTADIALRKSLLRHAPAAAARLPAAPPGPDAFAPEDRALLHNVSSALLRYRPVRAALLAALSALCEALGIPVPGRNGGKKGETVRARARAGWKEEQEQAQHRRDEGEGEGEDDGEELHSPGQQLAEESAEYARKQARRRRKGVPVPEHEKDPMEITSEEDGPGADQDPMEITSDEEDDEDGGEESTFEGFSEPGDDDDDDDNGISSDGSSEPGPRSRSRPPPRKNPASSSSRKPTQTARALQGSTFLPTLLRNGYMAGSESASDLDDEDLDLRGAGRARAARKRRGQRARQAIWELKYKAQARHLQRRQAGGDAGWDARRGAVGPKDRARPWQSRRAGGGAGERGGGERRAGAPALPPKRRRQEEDAGPLHPSWEAARKAKEKTLTAPFQGKKIVFD